MIVNSFLLCTYVKGSQPLEPVPVSSEEDVFDYISYDYKEPSERNM